MKTIILTTEDLIKVETERFKYFVITSYVGNDFFVKDADELAKMFKDQFSLHTYPNLWQVLTWYLSEMSEKNYEILTIVNSLICKVIIGRNNND